MKDIVPVVRENINVIANTWTQWWRPRSTFRAVPSRKNASPHRLKRCSRHGIDNNWYNNMEMKKPNLHNAEFLRSAVKESDFPHDPLPQIVFAGKSNVNQKLRSSTNC